LRGSGISTMTLHRIACRAALWLSALNIFLAAPLSQSQEVRPGPRATHHSEKRLSGKQVFAASCAGCHGLDGMGGERAPNIVANPQVQKLQVTEIVRIVSNGVPGTGMPPFQRLGKPAIISVVAYLRDLQGKRQAAPLPGDPKRGEAIFFGSG